MPNQSDLENIDLIAPLYDLDFAAFPREDLELYQWLSETHGKNILELGVGTGRIGVGLAQSGATVTGIDLSEQMIVEATKLAKKQNVEINLIVSDMTDFELTSRFDLICAPMGTLQHCQDINEVVNTFRMIEKHLDDEGIAVIDVDAPLPDDFTPPPMPPIQHWSQLVTIGSPPELHRVTKTVIIEPEPAISLKHVVWHYDITNEVARNTHSGGAAPLHRVTAEFSLLTITPGEIQLAANLAGMELLDLYGDYDLSPYGDGVRQIALLKRQELS